jgi:hypothetical protein
MSTWPANPQGDMTQILEASVEAAKLRHPSGKDVSPESAPDVPDTLTAADRCDRCSAGALYQLQHRTKQLELVLCHHHGRRLAPVMGDWTVTGQNLSLMRELYATNRLKGEDHG